jgi:hypothetical protein
MKDKLEELLEVNSQLQDEQQMLRYKYDQVSYCVRCEVLTVMIILMSVFCVVVPCSVVGGC